MAAEQNLIKSEDLKRIREVQFTLMFGTSLKKLREALGITRMIAKQAGTNLAYYKVKGTLQDGKVAEGDIIPLSKYENERVPLKEMTINKWRKAVSVESIAEKGYDQAQIETRNQMIKDVQSGIRKEFFDFLATGTGVASGTTFQAALAQAWGQLQVLFEDDEIQTVYFMNPLDLADYLASAPITLQDAFGMKYISDFLGLGTVIMTNSVPKGTVYATAKSNIVLYYIPVNGADIGEVFDFYADELGLVGIHEGAVYNNLTAEDVVMSGLVLFAERIDGVVVSKIGTTNSGGGTETGGSGTGSGEEGNEDLGA